MRAGTTRTTIPRRHFDVAFPAFLHLPSACDGYCRKRIVHATSADSSSSRASHVAVAVNFHISGITRSSRRWYSLGNNNNQRNSFPRLRARAREEEKEGAIFRTRCARDFTPVRKSDRLALVARSGTVVEAKTLSSVGGGKTSLTHDTHVRSPLPALFTRVHACRVVVVSSRGVRGVNRS